MKRELPCGCWIDTEAPVINVELQRIEGEGLAKTVKIGTGVHFCPDHKEKRADDTR